MDKRLRLSSLKSGDVVEGKLTQDTYSTEGEIFSSGSTASLSVDHVEKRRRYDSGRWPWVVSVFTPRWQRFPVFKEVHVVGPGDVSTTLPISMVSSGRKTDILADSTKNRTRGDSRSPSARSSGGQQLLLETRDWIAADTSGRPPGPSAVPGIEATNTSQGPTSLQAPAGTRCRILLLNDVRSSSSQPGDPVHAVLLEPVIVDHQVLFPAGSTFEGSVDKVIRPRTLSRAGTLSIAFDRISRPDGMSVRQASSVVGVEVDSASRMRLDEEGRMHGGPPGLKWLLIDGGVSAGLTKVADDTTQLVIESIVSSATDASTAGTARFVAMGVSGIFMLTRHGRDVRLPKYTEMTVTLERPAPQSQPAASGGGPVGLRSRPAPGRGSTGQ